ncbi:hypothetical protein Ancab_020952 [Ancistrocladus abbreviatus]
MEKATLRFAFLVLLLVIESCFLFSAIPVSEARVQLEKAGATDDAGSILREWKCRNNKDCFAQCPAFCHSPMCIKPLGVCVCQDCGGSPPPV